MEFPGNFAYSPFNPLQVVQLVLDTRLFTKDETSEKIIQNISVSLDSCFPACTCKLVSFFYKPFNKPLEDYIKGRRLNLIVESIYLKSFTSSLQSHPLQLTLQVQLGLVGFKQVQLGLVGFKQVQLGLVGLNRFSQVQLGLNRFSQVQLGLNRFSKVQLGLNRLSQVQLGIKRFSQVQINLNKF